MVEGLAMAVIEALVSFLVRRSLETSFPVQMDNMPAWYGESVSGHTCESGMGTGGMPRAMDQAVADANARLVRRLEVAARAAVDTRMAQARDETEQAILTTFAQDAQAAPFVEQNAARKGQSYRDKGDKPAFVRMCVGLPVVEKYERARFDGVARTISRHRSNRAHEELSAETSTPEAGAGTKMEGK
jgi:hypothetical protein